MTKIQIRENKNFKVLIKGVEGRTQTKWYSGLDQLYEWDESMGYIGKDLKSPSLGAKVNGDTLNRIP